MLMDRVNALSMPIERLQGHQTALVNGAMSVGSVEFVRAAMALAGITEPLNISYPPYCHRYLHRELKQLKAGQVLGRWFVKPLTTKTFTGFVFDTMEYPADLSDHDQEQHRSFMALPEDALVWVSEPVKWVSEWRYYVAHSTVIGQCRYDAYGADEEPSPDISVVENCVRDLSIKHPYAIDFGVLSTGETALVEVNDAWAIGLYGDALSPRDYLAFLRSRWRLLTRPFWIDLHD